MINPQLGLIKDDSGKTPFCYAKEANKQDIVEVLVSNRYGEEKNSLLHLAAKKGHSELISSILEEGVEVDELNDSGESAVYLAAKNGHVKVVKLLLKRGAEATDIFQHAIKSNDVKLIKLLLKEKDMVLFGRDNNFPAFHILSNKYLEERKVADKKIRKYSSAIYICAVVYTVAISVIYPNIVITTAGGMLVLVIAIVASKLTKEYIEQELQKKISTELESEKTSRNESERTSPVLSDVEIQSTSSNEAEEPVLSRRQST